MGIRAICREVGVSRKAVRRALRLDGTPRYSRPQRPNPKLVPFEAEIRRLYFTEHLIGSRILREVRPAYTGSASALYTYLKGLRASVPSSKETERFEPPPGFQAQFDWSPYTIDLGGELFRVIVFCMVLGYSRRKHYTASLDETQASIFEAIESCLRHFGASPKQLLIDNAKAFVLDPNPAHFRWNPQFLELCGHYRIRPRACQPYRAQTKGKSNDHFSTWSSSSSKAPTSRRSRTSWRSWRSSSATIWTCVCTARRSSGPSIVSSRSCRTSRHFPNSASWGPWRSRARSAGIAWSATTAVGTRSQPLKPASWCGCCRVVAGMVLDARREVLVQHRLSDVKGAIVILPEHYAPLRRTAARTYVVLAEQFLERFPHQAAFLDGLVAQHKMNPADHLRGVMELASLYDTGSLERAFGIAQEYNTYSHGFVRGLLESTTQPEVDELAPLAGRPP